MGRLAAAALSLGLVVTLAACQTAMAPARAKEPAAEPTLAGTASALQPTSVEGAVAELDRAELEVNQAFGGGSKPASPMSDPRGGTDLSSGAGDACSIACRALGSMERSAARLCELAGDGERCDAAKARVKSASDRVHGACPGCAGE
jgi:hypothetical protein